MNMGKLVLMIFVSLLIVIVGTCLVFWTMGARVKRSDNGSIIFVFPKHPK